jgi:mannose-6-phosphate isomerase-like protein (cupin superfamily)
MTVGRDSCSVQQGDLIHIPPDTVHFIENTGDKPLAYVSASTPAYDFKALYDEGDLKP